MTPSAVLPRAAEKSGRFMTDIAFEIYVRLVVEACMRGVTYPSQEDLINYVLVARDAAAVAVGDPNVEPSN